MRCFPFETGIRYRRKIDFFPEDTTISYSVFEPKPTRLQAEVHFRVPYCPGDKRSFVMRYMYSNGFDATVMFSINVPEARKMLDPLCTKLDLALIFYKLGDTPNQIKDELDSVYGDCAPSFTTVKFWAAELKRGCKSLEDDERSGSPNTANTD
ncbi:HTH_48 domain-containing protein [Trichonephila clavipes]|nr:HTH_48 domain-containing protein [Trichonephila clavipes]